MGRDHLAVGLDMRGYNLSSRPEGLKPGKMPHLVEDVRQFVEKIAGKNKKFILVGHDWGANVPWVFAMQHPEIFRKLIIVNGAHPFDSERELRENPAQRYASNYFFVFNEDLAPGEQPVDEHDTKDSGTVARTPGSSTRRSGRPLHRRRSAGVDRRVVAAGLHDRRPQLLSRQPRNPPFNDVIPRRRFPVLVGEGRHSGRDVTIIKTPTLVIWGMRDTAILSSHLSGLDKWVTNLRVRLYPDDDHWVMLEKDASVAQDIRRFVDDKAFRRSPSTELPSGDVSARRPSRPRRADEQLRVRAGLRHELLRASVLVVAAVQVAVRVHA